MKKVVLNEIFAFSMGMIVGQLLCKRYIAEFEYQNDILAEQFHNKNEELHKEREKWRHREEWHAKRFEALESDRNRYKEKINALESDRNRYKEKWELVVKMKKLSDAEENVVACLLKRGYKHIAVYGCGEFGEWLIDEIICNCEHTVSVRYMIDQKKNGLSYKGISILQNVSREQIDAVIVTTVGNIDEVKEYLMLKEDVPVIELKDIVVDSLGRAI